jgi:hypothetical protein
VTWTLAQIREHNARVAAAEAEARGAIPHAKLEPQNAKPLVRAAPRKIESVDRTRVRFIGRRTRLLDADNFAASVKDLLDGLAMARLILGDDPEHIVLVTEQEKVREKKEECTIVEIEWPAPP